MALPPRERERDRDMDGTLGVAVYSTTHRLSPQRRARLSVALVLAGALKVSVATLLVGITLVGDHYAVCTRVLLWPMIALGLFLTAISCCGCFGVAKQDDCLKILYLLGLCVAIPAVLAFVIFGYIAVGGIDMTNPVQGREYILTEYRGWLKGRVADPQYWSKISTCLHDRHACHDMRQLVRDPETGTFVPEHSSGRVPTPIESGCCKPPSSCSFKYVNGTTWTPTPGAPTLETNIDCNKWRNEDALCFQCDSCRAGLLDETKKHWTLLAICPILVLIVLSGSCCFLREIMDD